MRNVTEDSIVYDHTVLLLCCGYMYPCRLHCSSTTCKRSNRLPRRPPPFIHGYQTFKSCSTQTNAADKELVGVNFKRFNCSVICPQEILNTAAWPSRTGTRSRPRLWARSSPTRPRRLQAAAASRLASAALVVTRFVQ
ncbi:hypothetical protein PF005_g30231 [Phytophthora fragariae]|uniref:Uncharacterized protein n=1 Tax=Phytophthora fragariae TaxID=53985 RepID=A0A6A3VKZ3_9STRA|nr:hypothetical protein PF005_g30231 [Phytophthora fragariae]KAE9169249.1 hypothetical protein PF002_g30407 [Phytophthora fragariae]